MNFWSSISKLPKSCSLCGSLSGVKSSNVLVSSIARALTSSGRALTAAVIMTRPPGNDLRKRSLRGRILALLPPWIASCSSGLISASQVGKRSLQRQSHSSHQFVPQGQVWCFRNHGIGVVLIQKRARGHGRFRDRLLAGRRTVREARPMTMRLGTVVATRAAGEAFGPPPPPGGGRVFAFVFSGG